MVANNSERKKKSRRIWFIVYSIYILVIAVLIFLLLAYRPSYVYGTSMAPTLSEGDVLVTNMEFSEEDLDYGTIVIIEAGTVKTIVKRIVALPNDTICAHDGWLYVNGRPTVYSSTTIESFPDYVLSESQYFVLGDNTDNSKDSRYYGPFEFEDIKRIVVKKIIGKNKEIY